MESIEIKGTDMHQCIFVGTSDDNVFLSAMVRGGGCYMSIDREQAKKMVAALQQAIRQATEDSYDVAFETREEARLDAMFDAKYGDD